VIDLTVVTCLAPSLLGDPDLDRVARLLEPLVAGEVSLVAYVERAWKAPLAIRPSLAGVRWQETSAAQRWAGFSHKAELETAHAAPSPSPRPSLDYFVTTLTRMGMLHDQSIWNPFGTRYLVWIDADLTASVHSRYFTDERLLTMLPCLMERFLLLTRPRAVTDAAGVAAAARVQSQLFGGELTQIAEVNARYYQLLAESLQRGQLPSADALFSRILAAEPERFDRVVLQDNGLLGPLFEALRAGQVPLERTVVY
jgi:hypothetical protein